MTSTETYRAERNQLVERLARSNRIADPRVLEAFRAVPRHLFVPESQRFLAHEDRALPIGLGQTISQPTMIAIMLDALAPQPADRALEVGAGCGYAAALLARLVKWVDGIELLPDLAELARANLEQAGIGNVTIHVGNGTLGLPAQGPFQRIMVSAGAAEVPEPLTAQLAVGGRIVIPVGQGSQTLLIGDKRANGQVSWRESVPCVFVPLLG